MFSRIAPFGALVALVAATGCGQVREDRTVAWSGKGDKVGFQHGKEGLFVADRAGAGLQNIFKPAPDVLATGTPLWAPNDDRLIFTTAKEASAKPGAPPPARPRESEAGAVFWQVPIQYTCWLREPQAAGQPQPQPRPLFEAACDHAGYVAANLAVRWHPRGNSVFFIDQVAEGVHALFEFELATGQRRRAMPHDAAALVFDCSPDGAKLACALSAHGARPALADGLWIRDLGCDEWRHVPESQTAAPARLNSTIEQLRASLPAWSRAGDRFAFASAGVNDASQAQPPWRIWVGDADTLHVELLAESAESLENLTWAPDGSRLGAIRTGARPSLVFVDMEGRWSALATRPVRHFVGWDSAGKSLAYVTLAVDPKSVPDPWALLLLADPFARDAVMVAPADGRDPGREIVSGLRVTFPRWSPREEKLSLWFTFAPSHASALSSLLGSRLLPGDPAAIFDVAAGRIDWMAVNTFEQAQIAHIQLLNRNAAEAWRWYELAARGAPAEGPPTTIEDYRQRLTATHENGFFEYICLRRLNRHDEARNRLGAFRERFPPQLPALLDQTRTDANARELLLPGGFVRALVQDLYALQASLSVDAADVGEAYFRERLASPETAASRLSAALALTQVFLLQDRRDEFVELAAEHVAPLALEVWSQDGEPGAGQRSQFHELLQLAAGAALLPLASDDFMSKVDATITADAVATFDSLRPRAGEPAAQALDLALLAAYRRLGESEKRAAVAQRIDARPPDKRWVSAAEAQNYLRILQTAWRRYGQLSLE